MDSKIAPNFEEALACFSYVENIETGEILPFNSLNRKKTVSNILSTQIKDPYSLLSLKEGHNLVIFQLNILPTVEKAYYYELVSYSKPENDIKIYSNEKKNELLETVGVSLGQHP